uniref:Uncharacterized protein n=1 Tax=Physcomitrium patens TaxID=3218 RepID=A0A2K1KCH7_PHYPA|nr:hypothetical protein PHYPA_010673 [Physcomitrium patens]
MTALPGCCIPDRLKAVANLFPKRSTLYPREKLHPAREVQVAEVHS